MNPSNPSNPSAREPDAPDMPDELRWQLRALRQPQAPARDLWPDIAARLATTPQQSANEPRRWRWPVPASLAAGVLLAVGAMVMLRPVAEAPELARVPPAARPVPGAAPARATPTLVQIEAAGLTREYQAAVTEIAAVPPSPVLQPAIEELDRSAALIRDALERDPDSRMLLQQLRRTYTRRLALVQHVG